MSAKDNLYRLVDQLPENKVLEAERLVMQLLRSETLGQPRPGKSFEEALSYTTTHFDTALRNLAK